MIDFKDGQKISGSYIVSDSYIEIEGIKYQVMQPAYYGETPISAENLNKIQTDLQKLIEDLENDINTNAVTLYENEQGTKTDITLSESAENFEYIEIFFTSDDIYNSVKIPKPNGKRVNINNSFTLNNIQYLYLAVWSISNTKLSFVSAKNNFIDTNNDIGTYGSDSYIKIVKVVGYRR